MSKIILPVFHSADDIVKLINELGFLPFFRNEIEGFSIAECCPPELWFSDVDGPWEWKGPIIKKAGCAYGKFYKNKAMFVSCEWFPDFANYRRDGYDYDSRMDQGIARHKDNDIMSLIRSFAKENNVEIKQIKDVKIAEWKDMYTEIIKDGNDIRSAIKKYRSYTTNIDSYIYNNWVSFCKYDIKPGRD